ncbi:MAG: hypothetical protein ACLUEV_00995 [Alistipes sp.]
MFDKVVSFCGQNLTVAQVAATLNVLDYDTYFTIAEQILAGLYERFAAFRRVCCARVFPDRFRAG